MDKRLAAERTRVRLERRIALILGCQPCELPHMKIGSLARLNYGRFHQRLREVLEDGHDVVRCELQAPRGGFRFVRAHAKEGLPLTWNQPWEGECL